MKRTFLCFLALGVLIPWASGESDQKEPTQQFLKKAAYTVDTHVAKIFRDKELAVPSVVDDPTFLRRSFLVAAGRIPTLGEAASFLEISDENKREILINYLLKSDGYRSHMQNYVFDLLRAKDPRRPEDNAYARPYLQFIQESVAANKPWNQFARELISAEGIAWEEGNGAVGYFIRDKGMPLDNLSMTMQVFTGERMECAQCHDSPTNKWERMDFFEMAAFTHGQRQVNDGMVRKVREEADIPDFRQNPFGRFLLWMEQNIHYGTLAGQGEGRMPLPDDYQYSDGDPGEIVGARTHFGEKVRSSARRASGKSRVEFAEWMTTKNPNFDYVAVNRMWERVMGSPITFPVDEYVQPEKTISPELVEYLQRLMVDLDYNLKAFQNVLLLTKTFQFSANPNAFEVGVPQAFNGRQLERMTAEQMWDSLVSLVSDQPDELPKREFTEHINYRGKRVLIGEITMAELARKIMSMTDPEEYVAYCRELFEKINAEVEASASKSMGMTSIYDNPGPAKGLARASELEAPAPVNHFLREFGQSDRELLNASTLNANLPQLLEIINGQVERMVVSNQDAAVYEALKIGTTEADKVRYMYYAILSRPPTEAEMSILMRDVIDGSRESYQNLVSALILTHEFMFVQ